MAKFKLLDRETNTHFITDDIKVLLEAKGRKALPGKRRMSSVDRPKTFSGGRSAQLINGSVVTKTGSLEDLAAKNDTAGYVSTWLALNHLKGEAA